MKIKNKAKILTLVIFLLLSFMMIPVNADLDPASPNYMGFDPSTQHVTIGDSVDIDFYGDIYQEITTYGIDNLTYLPAGVIDYISTTSGDLFGGTTLYGEPESDGEIHNDAGWCKFFLWGHTGGANNTNATAFDTSWDAAGVGMATLTITDGGTAYGGIDPGTTKYPGYVYVHPEGVSGFATIATGPTNIDLSWTKGNAADKTLIRWRDDGTNPTSVTDGTLLYNDTGVATSHPGLTGGDHIYYSAWGWNETEGFYSIDYETADAFTNSPPEFGTPSPTNGSGNQELSLTWSIPITDAEGDPFDWEIECSNGQTASDTDASNGTKQLALSGLAYSITYTVWVNATDDGSSQTTSEWFTFDTKANTPPAAPSNPVPADTATNVDPEIGYLRCVVSDANGEDLDVSFYWENHTLIGTDLGVTSGQYASVAISDLLENTGYDWYVNVTDGFDTTHGPTWNFTTGTISKVGGGAAGQNDVLILVLHGTDPVNGASVSLNRGTDPTAVGPLVATATTEADGTYEFNVGDGNYILTVAYPGLETQNIPLTVREDTQYVVYMVAVTPIEVGVGLFILTIALLLLGLLLAYLTVQKKMEENIGLLLFALINAIAIIIGILTGFFIFIAAGAILLLLEFLWVKR